MPARTGKDYTAALKRKSQGMTVYLHGKRVADVTAEPLFQGPLQAVAELYDMQHDPAYREIMTYTSPTTGDPVSTSYMVPRSPEDVTKMRKAFKLRADQNFGFMGRQPDFMNSVVTGWAINKNAFGTRGQRFADNAQRYYEYCRENDIFLTHVLITPQVDRSKTSSDQEDPFIHLGRAGANDQGIVVRGAKMVGTFAPLTEEILVLPFGGVAVGDSAYAVTFSIPTDAPGLKFICRETVAPLPRSRFDHPLSSRFEEMDCLAIFDDVLVPWDRVMVDGGPGSEQVINAALRANPLTGLQTASRMLAEMEFMTGLAIRLAESVGIDGFLHVQEKLGEMISMLEVGRSVYYGSEAMAVPGPDGMYVPGGFGLRAFHLQTMRIYRRMVEITQILAAGGFFSVPTEADMNNPEERAYIDKFLRGKPGVSAEERVRLLKLAWDATSESFAQRMVQYVTYYSGDPVRLTAATYLGYNKQPLFDIVDRAMGLKDPKDIPVSKAPWEEGAAPAIATGPNPRLAYTYPAATHARQHDRHPPTNAG